MAPKVLATPDSHILTFETETHPLARFLCIQGACVHGAEGTREDREEDGVQVDVLSR